MPVLGTFPSQNVLRAHRWIKAVEPLFEIGWMVTENPVEGDGVLLGANKREIHVGVWTGDSVLHCLEELGVVQTKQMGYKFKALHIRRFFTPR